MLLLRTNPQLKYWLMALIAFLCAVVARLPVHASLGDFLWAEDGNVFVNQADRLGVNSIFEPYAGYLLIYPRIIAYVGIIMGLESFPYLFFCGWLAAAAVLFYVFVSRLNQAGCNRWLSILAAVLVLMQPHNGEVYFNITNAQWFLGAALMLMVCMDPIPEVGFRDFICLSVFCLTGPFSILLLPLLLLRMVVEPELKKKLGFYVVFFGLTAIQVFFLVLSSRLIKNIYLDKELSHWLHSFYMFLSFGLAERYLIFVFLFWAGLFYGICHFFRASSTAHRVGLISGGGLIFSLLVTYVGGLWSNKGMPQVLDPMSGSSRYFFIPYAIAVFLVCFLLIRRRIVLGVSLISFTVICIIQFRVFEKNQIFYEQYAQFSNQAEGVVIPINPVGAVYPGWHIAAKSNLLRAPLELGIKNLSGNGVLRFSSGGLEVSSDQSDPFIIFESKEKCSSHYIGVRLDVQRHSEGWAQIFWAGSDGFTEANSALRFYPRGRINMDFVVPNTLTGTLRFDPIADTSLNKIFGIDIYCLGN
ncbi:MULTISPECIES: hypothetical protein [unclassified Pseudomonas]|uniref:hypothetical protein n=1 Tax=unclassified Pseudomonas TaxID=196821 RepID=UPI002AC90122|nr:MULTISPECIES: hypothetical protein [unclassified Pseudomonas]MEB0047235.1 hypothetical protein [Pseudomonas sp. Dout3]MEB0096875.1 hypothetical protein [Pseudomonas sp. DC1.2]WPX57387.1 hypothetical protein RHM68_17380 [Pseudomonas sp. DC1.2]